MKAIKAHIKNGTLCREGVLALQAKVFDKDGMSLPYPPRDLQLVSSLRFVLHASHAPSGGYDFVSELKELKDTFGCLFS